MRRHTSSLIVMLAAAAWLVGAAGCEDETPDKCGNGVQDIGETCDGSSVGDQSCVKLGFAGGDLGCNDSCSAYDTTACVLSVCGNGDKEPSEACDGDDLGGNSCTTLGEGFVGGTLICDADCHGYDTSQCVLPDLGGIAGVVSIDAAVTCDASTQTMDCEGFVYLAVYEDDPAILPNQVPLATAMVDEVDLSGDASEVAYAIPDVPVGTWYLAAFLDDNDNAGLTAERPDAGDPTYDPFQVTVTIDATTTQDLTLDMRMQ